MMSCTPPHVDIAQFARIAESADLTRRVGACEHPIQLRGSRLHVEHGTGRVTERFDAADLPGGVLLVRCGSRRASVCVPCSTLYKLDAFHVIAAGLRGGKDMPDTVATHPRLFVTVTAPSFGAVHRGPSRDGTPRLCNPKPSSAGLACGQVHEPGDPAIGAPLDAGSYDYTGQVLFNAYAGVLWSKVTVETRRSLAAVAGLSRRQASRRVRVVFAKVAEFQGRGIVHFHAVVRMDGVDGPPSRPPSWATRDALTDAITTAVSRTTLSTPDSRGVPSRVLRFGVQLDIRPITADDGGSPENTIARYIAKYTTKGTESAGLDLGPIHCPACTGAGCTTIGDPANGRVRLCRNCHGTGRREGVDLSCLSSHTRALVQTCWRLGIVPELAELRLRRWAHILGYRGHVTTKSRSYSTTFRELRDERREWMATQQPATGDNRSGLLVLNDWHYAGHAPAGGGGDA